MGCHFLLQGIFQTQGSNPGSPALQADSLMTEPPGKSPAVLYWHVFCDIFKPHLGTKNSSKLPYGVSALRSLCQTILLRSPPPPQCVLPPSLLSFVLITGITTCQHCASALHVVHLFNESRVSLSLGPVPGLRSTYYGETPSTASDQSWGKVLCSSVPHLPRFRN